MSALLFVGSCCFLISIWGVLQLTVMSICYYMEAVTLVEDCEQEHDYDDYDDFIAKTKSNYATTGRNCLIAAVIYLALIFVSFGCIKQGKKKMQIKAALMEDDFAFCKPKEPPKTDPKKVQ